MKNIDIYNTSEYQIKRVFYFMTNEEQGGSLMNQQMQTAPGTAAQPPAQLKTNRSLLKFILLSLITFGIYGIVVMSSISNDINLIAGRYDGKKTMHYCLLIFIVGPITCGIATLVWHHKLSARIGAELGRRGINYSFGASDYWLWNVVGSLIVVGPFIFFNKLFTAMNMLSENYNVNG